MSMENKSEQREVNLLVVEDSPSQAEKLKYILEKEGYKVSIAQNGKKALSLIQKEKPTVVITDIVMPEMDGYQLCEQIKKDEELKDIPVILLTALSGPSDVVRGLECGANHFIT
jgi:PleD family two-component response regulator